MDALGTVRTWVLDGALGGALVPAVIFALFVGVPMLLGELPEAPGRVARDIAVSVAAGASIGALLAGPARVLAARSWRTAPALAFALGPLFGALAAGVLVGGMTVLLRGPALGADELALTLGFGAVALGPPWIAYVAVRVRGRSGTAVVLASALWLWVPVALVVVSEWVNASP